MNSILHSLLVCFALLPVSIQSLGASEVGPREYRAVSGIAGTLSAAGSDTVANLTTFWAEEFKRIYPNVNIQIQATGSSAAPTALTETTANIGLMSRNMRRAEIESFTARYGYPPTPIPVALEREFIRMVLSSEGQEIVSRSGYIPLPSALAGDTLNALAP